MLEKLQHMATKLVIEFKELTFKERLTRLKLYRLEKRRLRGYLFEFFKLLFGKANINPDKFFNINLNNLRGRSKTLNTQRCMELCRHRFFSQSGRCLEFIAQQYYICTLNEHLKKFNQ